MYTPAYDQRGDAGAAELQGVLHLVDLGDGLPPDLVEGDQQVGQEEGDGESARDVVEVGVGGEHHRVPVPEGHEGEEEERVHAGLVEELQEAVREALAAQHELLRLQVVSEASVPADQPESAQGEAKQCGGSCDHECGACEADDVGVACEVREVPRRRFEVFYFHCFPDDIPKVESNPFYVVELDSLEVVFVHDDEPKQVQYLQEED